MGERKGERDGEGEGEVAERAKHRKMSVNETKERRYVKELVTT